MKGDLPDAPALPPATSRALEGRRVVILLGRLELGGAERQAVHLANHLLHRERAAVEVWGFADVGAASRLCASLRIPARLVPLPFGRTRLTRWPVAIARLSRNLRDIGCEVLLPYCADANVPAGLSWRAGGARTCVWNQRDEGIGLTGTRWERLAVRCTPAFISNSSAGAELLAARYGIAPHRIRLVANGVRLPEARATRREFRERLRLDEDAFAACMLATVSTAKDHDTLLRAWRLVSHRMGALGRRSCLLVAGRDAGAASVRELAAELGIAGEVRVLGEVDDVAGLLAACDLLVFSSRSEGCPNAVLEAMAAGLPVVATDIAGVREALGPGTLDCLAAPGDASGLADRVLAMAADPSRRATSGAANRHRAEAEFTVESMCRKTTSVVAEALGAPRRATGCRTAAAVAVPGRAT